MNRHYRYSLQNHFAGSIIVSLNQLLHFRLMWNHDILDLREYLLCKWSFGKICHLPSQLWMPELVHHILHMIVQEKILLYSVWWPDFVIWLPLLLEILDSMCIEIICFPIYIIHFEINLSFLANPFPYMTKKVWARI